MKAIVSGLGSAISQNLIPAASRGLQAVATELGGKQAAASFVAHSLVKPAGQAIAGALAQKIRGAGAPGAQAIVAHAVDARGPDFINAVAERAIAQLRREAPQALGTSAATSRPAEAAAPAFLDVLSQRVIDKLLGGAPLRATPALA